jgi:general secretion pathway protein I
MRSNQDGFTLLEVLVAFSILVMGLAAVYRIFIGGLHNEQVVEAETSAVLWAQSRLSAIGVTEPLAANSGSLENGRSWRVDVSPVAGGNDQGPAQSASPYWVTVTVTWGLAAGEKRRSVSLTTVKLAAPQ